MSDLQGAFAPNREDIAAKVIDGELIIIRLSDGTYYSMDNVGTRIWELIDAGQPVPALIQTIASSYATPVERVQSDVGDLLRGLLAERLIVATPAGEGPPIEIPEGASGSSAYEAPRMNIYRDMGNLLALDPPTPGIDDMLFKGPKGE